jgi:hypothetical protein
MGGRDKILYNQLRLRIVASKELCILNVVSLSSSESNLKIECI